MLQTYYTVNREGSGEQIIQKSKFIGYVKRVETEEEAQSFIQQIKKKHYDATHNCSAYLIGEFDQIQKANDDGEPSGTAGVPILEVLKKKQLKDTVVVVTRYFGGVKLGAGGLIRAYSSTTSLAIESTGIVKCQLMRSFSIEVDYTLLGMLQNEIKESNYILQDIEYQETVKLKIYAEEGTEEAFSSWIINLTNNQVKINAEEVSYIEIEQVNI